MIGLRNERICFCFRIFVPSTGLLLMLIMRKDLKLLVYIS